MCQSNLLLGALLLLIMFHVRSDGHHVRMYASVSVALGLVLPLLLTFRYWWHFGSIFFWTRWTPFSKQFSFYANHTVEVGGDENYRWLPMQQIQGLLFPVRPVCGTSPKIHSGMVLYHLEASVSV